MFKAKKILLWCLIIAMGVTVFSFIPQATAKAAVDFNTMPIPTVDTSRNGYNILKTMYLLETSTAEKPNTVRIAITGQSISDSNNIWGSNLINWLKVKYPTANIVFENFAIGGFGTAILYKRVPNDMASFHPDLVIINDYGDQNRYEQMIKYMRETIGAEVMMQTYHYTGVDAMSDSMSYSLLPEIAYKYGAELCRLREIWKKYLETNNLLPSALLLDGVHLNLDGQTLMLELMKQFFVYRDSNAAQVISTQTKSVAPSDWVDGKLIIYFKGTRAEINAGNGTQYATNILVDAKAPSQHKECYIRSAEFLGMTDTNLGIINFNSVPGEQLWTLEITSVIDLNTFTVKATGSQTGDEGTSVDSVLKGTHLQIDKESFIWDYTKPTVGKKYTFSSILNGCDAYDGSKKVLFSGLANTNHILVIEAKDQANIPDIKSIQFYDPSAKVVSKDPAPTPIPEAPNRPEMFGVTDKSTKVSGYALDSGTITLTVGSSKYTTAVLKDGTWSKTLPKALKVNTKISATITVNGQKSSTRLVFVKPTAPTVNKITAKSKNITGKTYSKAKVAIMVRGKWMATTATSKGAFTFKLSQSLKIRSNIYVKVTYLGQVSAEKQVKVF